jgi:hypothetical protein
MVGKDIYRKDIVAGGLGDTLYNGEILSLLRHPLNLITAPPKQNLSEYLSLEAITTLKSLAGPLRSRNVA